MSLTNAHDDHRTDRILAAPPDESFLRGECGRAFMSGRLVGSDLRV